MRSRAETRKNTTRKRERERERERGELEERCGLQRARPERPECRSCVPRPALRGERPPTDRCCARPAAGCLGRSVAGSVGRRGRWRRAAPSGRHKYGRADPPVDQNRTEQRPDRAASPQNPNKAKNRKGTHHLSVCRPGESLGSLLLCAVVTRRFVGAGRRMLLQTLFVIVCGLSAVSAQRVLALPDAKSCAKRKLTRFPYCMQKKNK